MTGRPLYRGQMVVVLSYHAQDDAAALNALGDYALDITNEINRNVTWRELEARNGGASEPHDGFYAITHAAPLPASMQAQVDAKLSHPHNDRLCAWAHSMSVSHGYALLPMTNDEVSYMLGHDPDLLLQTAEENSWPSPIKPPCIWCRSTEHWANDCPELLPKKHGCSCGWTCEPSPDTHDLWEAHMRIEHEGRFPSECRPNCVGRIPTPRPATTERETTA